MRDLVKKAYRNSILKSPYRAIYKFGSIIKRAIVK